MINFDDVTKENLKKENLIDYKFLIIPTEH